MAKPLQQDENGNIIEDVETEKNKKGYAAYEADNARKQAEMEAKDQRSKDKYLNLMRSGLEMLGRPVKGMKKGGSVKASSASKRGDGCAIKGKTRGRMV